MNVDRRNSDRRFWERRAKDYDRSQALFGRPLPRVRDLTADAVSGADKVLEVAAGTGLTTEAIAPRVRRLVATDYADAMLDALRRRVRDAGLSNVECARGDIYALEYPSESFDAVVAANVLHLVPDLEGALAALKRLVRAGGTLVAPTFCHHETVRAWLASRALAVLGQPMHRRFTAASLQAAIESAGMVVRRAETVPGFIPLGFLEAVVSRDTPR